MECAYCGSEEIFYNDKCRDCYRLEIIEEQIQTREAFRLILQELDYSLA